MTIMMRYFACAACTESWEEFYFWSQASANEKNGSAADSQWNHGAMSLVQAASFANATC